MLGFVGTNRYSSRRGSSMSASFSPAFPAPIFRAKSLNLISGIRSTSIIYYVRLLGWGVAWLPFLPGSIFRMRIQATSCQTHTTFIISVPLSEVQLFPFVMLQKSNLYRKMEFITRTRIRPVVLSLVFYYQSSPFTYHSSPYGRYHWGHLDKPLTKLY